MDDRKLTPSSLIPIPDPISSGPDVRPFVSTVDTDRRHTTERGNVERQGKLEKPMLLAERERDVTLDPVLRLWLLAIIRQQSDGSEVYLPGDIEKKSTTIRAREDEAKKSVMSLKERSMLEMTDVFSALTEMKATLEDTGKSEVDTSAAVKAVTEILKKEADVRALRAGVIDIAYVSSDLLRKGATRMQLRNTVRAARLPKEFTLIIDSKVPVAPTEENTLLDQTFVENFILECMDECTKQFEGIKTAAETLRKTLRTRKTEEITEQASLLADTATERRAFNDRLGGTDAETVFGFANVGGDTYDLSLLEEQMAILGWKKPDTQSERIQALRDLCKITIDIQIVIPSGDLGKADREKLTEFIAKNIQKNPPGLSLSEASNRIERFGILQSFALNSIQKNSPKNVIDMPKVISDMEAVFSGIALDEVSLKIAAGISADNSVDDDKEMKLATAIAKSLEGRAETLDDVKIATKMEVSTIPFSEDIKNYTRDAAGLSKEAFELWWAWIKTLPSTVYTPEENEERDKKLLASIKAGHDLSRLDSALEEIISEKSDGTEGKGDLLVELDASFAREKSEIEEAVLALAAASLPSKPATTFTERLEHSKNLLDVGLFVWKELNDKTCFADKDDPILRQRAFFIAMHYGIEEADFFLNNPEEYITRTDSTDKIETIDQDEVNFILAKEGKGDPLAPLELLGLSLDPRAVVIMANTLTQPHCIPLSIDCPPGVALRQILQGDTETIGNIITAYVDRKDTGNITVEEALRIVNGIKSHLNKQDHDMQKGIESRGDKRFDPINAINSTYEVVKDMIQGDTFAERALGWALVGGTVYGIIKAWPKHWKLIMAGPMLLAANVALKKATGKSIADQFNLHYMNEDDRNTSHEKFARRTRGMEGYEKVDSPAGREALNAITDPTKPISLDDLLLWRMKVKAAGPEDYVESAPPNIQNKLNTSRIINEMGLMETNSSDRKENVNAAYKLAFKAFEALCIDVARARMIGGIEPEQQAEDGANYIRNLYTVMGPDCVTRCREKPRIVDICGLPPNKMYTAREILTLERPPEWMYGPMETWTEYAAAKTGVGFGKVGRGIGDGLTFVEKKFEQTKEAAPRIYDWTKRNIMENYQEFVDWVYVSYGKAKPEVMEDLLATWNFLSKTTKELGLQIKVKGPGMVEWVYDGTLVAGGFAKDKAIDLWDWLNTIQTVGNTLEAFESMYASVTGESIRDVELSDIANFEDQREKLIAMIASSSPQQPGGITIPSLVDKWLKASGVARDIPPPSAPGAPALVSLGIEAFPNMTDAERMVRIELLKREIFSYMAAFRVHDIYQNVVVNHTRYYVAPKPLPIIWPKDFDKDTMQFTDDTVPARLKETHNYIRSKYNTAEILSLVGKEPAIPEGYTEAYAFEHPDEFWGGAASFADTMLGWAFRSNSKEYLTHGLEKYRAELLESAELKFEKNSEKYKNYKEYVETVLLNVIMESTMSDPGVTPSLEVTIQQAKKYLHALRNTRGEVPHADNVRTVDDTLMQKFHIPDHVSVGDELQAVMNDPLAHWRISGDLSGIVTPGVSHGAPSVSSTASGTPAVIRDTPPETIDALIKNNDVTKLAQQWPVIEGIRGAKNRANELRNKFDEKLPYARTLPYIADKKEELHNFLLGVTNVKEVENRILSDIHTAEDLKDLLNVWYQKDPALIDTELDRVQHALDRAVVKLLQDTSPTGVIPRLEKIKEDTPVDDATYLSVREDLKLIYKSTDPATAGLLRDTVSLSLEYLVLRGDYSSGIDAFNTQLQGLGLDPMHTTLPKRPWLGLSPFGKDAVAAERFKEGNVYRALLKSKIDTRLSAIKEQLDK